MIVHLVTDRRRLSGGADWRAARRCLLDQAEFAVAAGVDYIQVRERDVDARDLAALVADIVERARGSRTRIVVNDRVDVALAAGADGVHLRADSPLPDAVRRIVPEGFLIGCSVHSVREAAARSAADYFIAGTVWASASKPEDHPLLGIEGLEAIVRASRLPVVGIGGVTPERIRDVAQAGAAGVAAIGLFVAEKEGMACRSVALDATVDALRARFDTSTSHS